MRKEKGKKKKTCAYLRVDADDAVAIVTVVGENRLVTLDAVRMLVAQNVTLASQRLVALPATKVAQVPILRHGFRVFSAKNQLSTANKKNQNQIRYIPGNG